MRSTSTRRCEQAPFSFSPATLLARVCWRMQSTVWMPKGTRGSCASISKRCTRPHKLPAANTRRFQMSKYAPFRSELENAIDGLDAKGNPGFMRQYFEEMHKTAQTASSQHAKVSDEQVRAIPLMPADLVVYVNAATSSAMTRKRVRQGKKECPDWEG